MVIDASKCIDDTVEPMIAPGTFIAMFGIFLITVALIRAYHMLEGYAPLDLVKLIMAQFYVKSGLFMLLGGLTLNIGRHLAKSVGF